MLGRLFKSKDKPMDERIRQERQKWLDNMIARSATLKSLINNNESGWREFCSLLDDYIDKCKKRKVVTALDTATDETIKILKALDHEVWFLGFIKRIPEQFIKNTEERVAKEGKADANTE